MKVAIVGTGNVARKNYLPFIAAHEDVSLTYLNRTRSKAEEAAQQYGGRVADSVEDLMADDPDAVFVLTQETERYDVACSLLRLKPKRLFFEKPLVAQHGQADVVEDDFYRAKDVLKRAKEAGTETAMVFNYRFFDQSVRAKELLDTGRFGKPVHFTGLVHYACWSHCIDLLLYFVGSPAEISAFGSQQKRLCWGTHCASDVVAAVRTEDDATGSIIGTCGIDQKLPLYEMSFCYEGGRISMRDLDGPMEVVDYGTRCHELHTLSFDVSRWDQYNASFGRSINAYLDTVRDGAPPPIPGVAGLRELQFEAAIRRSIAQGCPVDVAKEFPIEADLAGTQ